MIKRRHASLVTVAVAMRNFRRGQTSADACRERAFLESVAKRRILITYQELATLFRYCAHSIHRVTEALERLMEEDAAADRRSSPRSPSARRVAICRARVLRLRRRLGRFAGDPDGQDARTFHAAELNAVFAC